MMTFSRKGLVLALLLAGSASSAANGQQATPAPAQPSTLGSTWADAERMPDLFTGMWMTFTGFVESDESVNVPYTPEAQAYVDQYEHRRDIPYAEEGCLPPGLPISMRVGPIKFSYSPGLITIYQQATGHSRFIRMNEPMGNTAPGYYGNSIGHWEGDTLVIETVDFVNEISFQYGVGEGLPPLETVGPLITEGPPGLQGGVGGPPGGFPPGGPPPGAAPGGPGFPPPGLSGAAANISKAIWGRHGDNLRMVERIRLLDDNTLEHKLTLYDDAVWTQPFVATTRPFQRIVQGVSEIGPFNGVPQEWVCTVSITSFDPATNTYVDRDPEEMVRFLDELGQ